MVWSNTRPQHLKGYTLHVRKESFLGTGQGARLSTYVQLAFLGDVTAYREFESVFRLRYGLPGPKDTTPHNRLSEPQGVY